MNRLKELRQEKRLTLRELAEKLNMTNSSISMMENEIRGISNENLKSFCTFFNVSSDYLLGLSDDRTSEATPTSSPKFSFALHGLEDELTDGDKDIIMDLAKSLAEKNKKQ